MFGETPVGVTTFDAGTAGAGDTLAFGGGALEFAGVVAGTFDYTGGAAVSYQAQVGDVGVRVIVQVTDDIGVKNLAGATGIEASFERPDGTMLVAGATLYTDGSDGKISYVTQPGDLDQAGTWKFQMSYALGGMQKTTAVNKFKVKPNLPV